MPSTNGAMIWPHTNDHRQHKATNIQSSNYHKLLCQRLKDGSASLEQLSDLKESQPVHTVEYVVF